MSFADYDNVAATAQWTILGELVTYTDYLAAEKTIQAIIDKNVEAFPNGFESQAPERRTEISMLVADVPAPKAGETITHGAVVYELVDLIEENEIVVVFTARPQ